MQGNAIRGLICAAVVFVLTSLIFIYDRFNTREIRRKLEQERGARGIDNWAVEDDRVNKE